MNQSRSHQTLALDHINMTVTNFNQSAAWYREVFGFEIVEYGKTPEGKPWGVLKKDESMLCLYEEQDWRQPADANPEKQHRFYHFAIRLSDENEWLKILNAKKLKTFYGSPIRYAHSTSWYVQDPSGHEIEVVFWQKLRAEFKQCGVSN